VKAYAKVADFDLLLSAFDEYVAWLEVSVHNQKLVYAIQSKQNFNDKPFDLRFSDGKPLLHLNQGSQVAAVAIFLEYAETGLLNEAI
jgi:hypothetical protein